MEHLSLITDIAKRWTENQDNHTRLELLRELRAATNAQDEVEVIGLLFQAVHAEHERANDAAAKAERKFLEWRDRNKPDNWAGDKRHLLQR